MQTADHNQHDHRRARAQAWARTALLLGLGLYFGYNIASGSLANYINARFAWLSYVAAALFLLLGAASASRLMRGGQTHQHGPDHDHGALSWGAIAVVAVPLALGTLIPSQPLGASAVGGGVSMDTSGGDAIAAFSVPPLDRSVLDWARAFNASDDLRAFNGQDADVTGFVYRSDALPADIFLVTRFVISCCVADSAAVGLPVQWDDIPPLDTWVRVLGRFELGTFQGEPKPILRPTSVEVVEQPAHPYLYP